MGQRSIFPFFLYLYPRNNIIESMKRSIIALCVALFTSVSAFATMPAGSYDEELHGADKQHNKLKHQVDINVGYIAGGKLNTKNLGKIKTNLARPYVDVVYGQ